MVLHRPVEPAGLLGNWLLLAGHIPEESSDWPRIPSRKNWIARAVAKAEFGCLAMHEPEPAIAMFQACHGNTYEPGTKKPKDPPRPFEEFDAECVVCRQRIALVLGTDHLKLHYTKCSPPKPQIRWPRSWRFWK
jgi:hypothetical protein